MATSRSAGEQKELQCQGASLILEKCWLPMFKTIYIYKKCTAMCQQLQPVARPATLFVDTPALPRSFPASDPVNGMLNPKVARRKCVPTFFRTWGT